MKLAIYYTGMIRTLKYCIDDVIKNIKKNNNDIIIHLFINVWSYHGLSLKHGKNVNKYPELCYENITDDFIINEFKEYEEYFTLINVMDYNKSLKIMNKKSKKDDISNRGNKHQMKSQSYTLFHTNNLRKKHFKDEKYDYFLRLRPDAYIKKFPKLIKTNNKILYLNKFVWECPKYISWNNINNDINENIYLTNSEEIINNLCDIYTNFDKIWIDKSYYGEKFAGQCLKYYKINKYIKLFNFDLCILRGNGVIQKVGYKRKK